MFWDYCSLFSRLRLRFFMLAGPAGSSGFFLESLSGSYSCWCTSSPSTSLLLAILRAFCDLVLLVGGAACLPECYKDPWAADEYPELGSTIGLAQKEAWFD